MIKRTPHPRVGAVLPQDESVVGIAMAAYWLDGQRQGLLDAHAVISEQIAGTLKIPELTPFGEGSLSTLLQVRRSIEDMLGEPSRVVDPPSLATPPSGEQKPADWQESPQ